MQHLLLCFFAFAFSAFASPQQPDFMIVHGKTYRIPIHFMGEQFKKWHPLESYFSETNPKPKSFGGFSSGHARGYTATFGVTNTNDFVVTKVQFFGEDLMKRCFPKHKEGPVLATWFTGVVRGAQDPFRNWGNIEIHVEKGKVVKIEKDPVLCVASYNIRHGRGIDGTVDLERTTVALRSLEADLIALQEVDRNCTRSGKVDMAAELGKALGMHHAFGSFLDFQGGEYGMAVLSRFPILAQKRHVLPAGAEPRCALEIQVATPGCPKLSFIGIHNDWTDEAVRRRQVTTLLTVLGEPDHATILAGDFNGERTDPSLLGLANAKWTIHKKKLPSIWGPGGPGAKTFPADKPTTEIDFIVTRGLPASHVFHKSINERKASDHLPIKASFVFKKPPENIDWPLAPSDEKKAIGKIYKTEVPTSAEPLVARSKYQLWIPEDAPSVRSIFAINMRAAGKHLFYQDPEWRALAARTGSAMMFCEFEAKEVRTNGYGLSMLKACDQFATDLSRPELQHAPLVLWGHSMGGRVAQDFARFRPSRVLAMHIALRKLPSPKAFMEEETAPMKVPALYLMGENDGKPEDMRQHFFRSRRNDSPRAWIWLPGQDHWPKGMSFDKDETPAENWRAWAGNDVVIPWTEAVIELRLPQDPFAKIGPVKLRELRLQDGWLGDVETGTIGAYGWFEGNKSEASWFPNEDVAKAWARFSFPER